MIKIMIVDDELYFREALKLSLPWDELGFTICGDAKNGKDALEKMDDLEPEIILVDINMPIMDGLEFVQEIRKRGLSCKIIILTGHSEFLYAKQAVQLGVFNYILKPISEKELTETLIKIKKTIDREKSISIEFNELKKQVKDSIPLLRDRFLNELIQGSFLQGEKDIEERMEYLGIHFSSGYYRVVTIEINDSEQWENEDKQLWKFAVSNISCEVLGEYSNFEMFYDNDDRICFITCLNENDQESQYLLESRLEHIVSAISRHLGFTITIGVGNQKKELYDITASYKESLVALKNKLIEGKNRVITYCSIEDMEIKVNPFTIGHGNQLLMHMRTGDIKGINDLLDQLFAEITKENLHYEIIYVICVEIVSVCMEYMIEAALPINEILQNNSLNFIEEIQSKGSIDEIKEWIEKIFIDTLKIASKHRSSKATILIEDVIKYIQKNYYRCELNIEEISKNLYVNYSHLCFTFKRETGITINEYLTDYRMNKAKELFDDGNNLILDVAERVGYADANYFGKCFKKYYGLSPSKYLE